MKEVILNKVKERWSDDTQIGFSEFALKEAIDLTLEEFDKRDKEILDLVTKLRDSNISKSKSFIEIPIGNWILFLNELGFLKKQIEVKE